MAHTSQAYFENAPYGHSTSTTLPAGWRADTDDWGGGGDDYKSRIEYQVCRQPGVPWGYDDSGDLFGVPGGYEDDGSLSNPNVQWYSGGLTLHLRPAKFRLGASSALVIRFSSCALNWFGLEFPPLLVDRVCNPITFDDTLFAIEAESSLLEPDGKRMLATLTEAATTFAVAEGFDKRTNYPMHWLDDEGNILAAGWVGEPESNEPRVGMDALPDLGTLAIPAKGILHRLDSPFLFLPHVLPDKGGYLEYGPVADKVLLARGIDPTDTDLVTRYPDPYTGNPVARLPGAWGETTTDPEADAETEGSFAPDWNNTALEYLSHILEVGRGWLIYEGLNGRIWMHPNLFTALQLGAQY
jgi:hypothetical protein